MSLKFTPNAFEKLQTLTTILGPKELWNKINDNTYQMKIGGVAINYYVTTGTIHIQGKQSKTAHYESIMIKLIDGETDINQPDIQQLISEETEVKNSKDIIFLSQSFNDSEIVIGLVGAIGTQYKKVKEELSQRLENNFNYNVVEIKISSEIIEKLSIYKSPVKSGSKNYDRINNLMNLGNEIRETTGNNSILALGAVSIINKNRKPDQYRTAYIIDSLKHPDEIKALREIYGQGFYLIGVYSDISNRSKYLVKELLMSDDEASKLIEKDENDIIGGHGQHTSDSYHLSDFFVNVNYNIEELKQSIFRFLDIIFGSPHITPLFEEYSMFMAFTASLRSADLSRQVGAVLTKNNDIIATGANDIPKYGGGLYWPYYNNTKNEYEDFPLGRDYTRGCDSNVKEREKIINEIIQEAKDKGIDENILEEILKKSRLKDLTEFGRVVHAEMETLMTCSRNNISARNSILFCTTFPCHNCAKHIVAAGVDKVYFIEPYPKSKALDFHSESIKMGIDNLVDNQKFTYFEPFIGVGPRKFFDLFSIGLGSGRSIKRKDKEGNALEWEPNSAKPKVQLFPISYLEREKKGAERYTELIVKS